jgi:hypothetical protein
VSASEGDFSGRKHWTMGTAGRAVTSAARCDGARVAKTSEARRGWVAWLAHGEELTGNAVGARETQPRARRWMSAAAAMAALDACAPPKCACAPLAKCTRCGGPTEPDPTDSYLLCDACAKEMTAALGSALSGRSERDTCDRCGTTTRILPEREQPEDDEPLLCDPCAQIVAGAVAELLPFLAAALEFAREYIPHAVAGDRDVDICRRAMRQHLAAAARAQREVGFRARSGATS